MQKFFAYDDETGFDTYDTAAEAKAAAEQSLQGYRDDAGEGWDEIAGNVCWGEIKQGSQLIDLGEKIEFDGELMDSVDYQLSDVEQ